MDELVTIHKGSFIKDIRTKSWKIDLPPCLQNVSTALTRFFTIKSSDVRTGQPLHRTVDVFYGQPQFTSEPLYQNWKTTCHVVN